MEGTTATSPVQERWLPIPGHEDYAVSDYGRVMRLTSRTSGKAGRYLKPQRSTYGYRHIGIRVNGRKKTITIHTLVMLAFIGPRPDGLQINHKDGVKTNNHLNNLEYVTPQYNSQHAYDVVGRAPSRVFGETCGAAKLTEAQVIEARARYNGKHGACAVLARQYGVDHKTMWLVLNRKSWTHI